VIKIMFSETEKTAIQRALSAVWEECAYDCVQATAEENGKNINAVTIPQAEVIEIALDAGGAEQRLMQSTKRDVAAECASSDHPWRQFGRDTAAVGSIANNLTIINGHNTALAGQLKTLTEAILASATLNPRQTQEATELHNGVVEDLAKPAQQRRSRAVMKTLRPPSVRFCRMRPMFIRCGQASRHI
jgi:hypothetical protein